jgi:hypothetical protein
MPSIGDLLQGIVIETKTTSLTGSLLYSDAIDYEDALNCRGFKRKQPPLNNLANYPIIGIVAGIARMALAVIHSLGHLLAAIVTCDKGHLIHAAKGGCEFLRGFIEAIPIAGRLFSNYYNDAGDWWIIKIYNPDAPDAVDRHADNWEYLKHVRPSGYCIA